MSPESALPWPASAGTGTRQSNPGNFLERFAAAVEAGKTIALVVAREPRAVIVYYFRDASRAVETLERLTSLSVSPAVAYVSAGDGSHRAAVQLDPASALALRAIDWLTRLIVGRA